MRVDVSIVRLHRIRPDQLESFRTTLSASEQAEAKNIDHAESRRMFVCARALVRLALSASYPSVMATDWTFVRDDAGKPRAIGPVADAPAYNLSHTDGLVACAVAQYGERSAPVGLDVEPLERGPEILDTVIRAFAPSEIAALRALTFDGIQRRAVELWTVKEAYLKGLGTGISRHLDRFSVRPGPDGVWLVDEDARWRVTVHEYEGFLLAVAILGRPTIVFRDALMYAPAQR